jgi:hypothetical protein
MLEYPVRGSGNSTGVQAEDDRTMLRDTAFIIHKVAVLEYQAWIYSRHKTLDATSDDI